MGVKAAALTESIIFFLTWEGVTSFFPATGAFEGLRCLADFLAWLRHAIALCSDILQIQQTGSCI